jgi:uncharacterized membrane protein YsdA (DUF1294 family)
MTVENIILGVLGAINIAAFLLVVRDKRKSIKGGASERTPEGLLFFMATMFGAVGVYAGMLVFRHKTKKWYFMLGVPLLILQNLATLYLLKETISLWGIL